MRGGGNERGASGGEQSGASPHTPTVRAACCVFMEQTPGDLTPGLPGVRSPDLRAQSLTLSILNVNKLLLTMTVNASVHCDFNVIIKSWFMVISLAHRGTLKLFCFMFHYLSSVSGRSTVVLCY